MNGGPAGPPPIKICFKEYKNIPFRHFSNGKKFPLDFYMHTPIKPQKPRIDIRNRRIYSTITVDMITIDYDLNKETTKKIFQLFWSYILKYKSRRQIFKQFFCADSTYSSLTILKTDIEEFLKEVTNLALNEQNWIAI